MVELIKLPCPAQLLQEGPSMKCIFRARVSPKDTSKGANLVTFIRRAMSLSYRFGSLIAAGCLGGEFHWRRPHPRPVIKRHCAGGAGGRKGPAPQNKRKPRVRLRLRRYVACPLCAGASLKTSPSRSTGHRKSLSTSTPSNSPASPAQAAPDHSAVSVSCTMICSPRQFNLICQVTLTMDMNIN